MALVSFLAAALIAALQWPVSMLFGRIARARRCHEIPRKAETIDAEPFEMHRETMRES
jgi:hypothetical protein